MGSSIGRALCWFEDTGHLRYPLVSGGPTMTRQSRSCIVGYLRRKSLLAQVALSRTSVLASVGIQPLSCGKQAVVRDTFLGAGIWHSALWTLGSSVCR